MHCFQWYQSMIPYQSLNEFFSWNGPQFHSGVVLRPQFKLLRFVEEELLGEARIVTYILICLTLQTKSLHILPSLQEKQLQLFQLLNSVSEEEITLLEAMKLLMFLSAVELYQRNITGDEVPVFVWLMYARDTSETPAQLLRNHINKCGDSGGLEQVSIFKISITILLLKHHSPITVNQNAIF